MELKDLLKRIIDTCNYNEMCIDTDMAIEYLCMITEPLVTKNAIEVSEKIIYDLMKLYRDSEDDDEMEYIQETICTIIKYLTTH